MSLALELWRVLEAWNPDAHPRGPGGRFVKGLGGGGRKHSLADAVKGTAEGGPKRQRTDKAGMSVSDAVRKAARTSDTTGRPTQHTDAEHRAHGAHDVADEVDRALAEAGASESVRAAVSGRARARADSHGPRPGTLPGAPKAAEQPKATQDEIKGEVFDAVHAVQPGPGDWVGLADVRGQLGDRHSRQDVDEALRGLLHHGGVRVIPVANTKALSEADRRAAVRIGGEDSHMMSIEPGTPRPGPAKATAAPALSEAEVRQQKLDAAKADVRSAVGRLQAGPGEWVGLARLRDDLGEKHNRHVVDAALKELEREPDVNIVPESKRVSLTAADHSSAVQIGNQDKHLISIGAGGSPAGPTQAEPGADVRAARGGIGLETGKQAWDLLLSGPQKEKPAERPKLSAAEEAARRRKVLDRTAATLAGGAPKRGNVFANPEFNNSTGRASSGLAGAQAAHAEVVQQLAAALRSAKSRDDARSAISALNVRELRGLAEHLQLKPGSKATKTKLLDAIVDGTAGRRLDSEALGRH